MSSVGKPDTHSFTWPEDGEEPPWALVPVVFATGLALPLLAPSDGDPAAAGVEGPVADAAADVGEDGVACESAAEVGCAPGNEVGAVVGGTADAGGDAGLALDVVGSIGGPVLFADAGLARPCELLAAAALSAHDIGAGGPSHVPELASDAGAAAELVAAGSAAVAGASFGVVASGVVAPPALGAISAALPFGDVGACNASRMTRPCAGEARMGLDCTGAVVSGWSAPSCEGDGSDGMVGAAGASAGDGATAAGSSPWCIGAWCCGRAGQLGS